MANNIKTILDLLKINYSDMCNLLNISPQQLYIVMKSNNPRKYNKQISNILGIDLDYITKVEIDGLDNLEIQKQYYDKQKLNTNDIREKITLETFINEIRNLIKSSDLNLWFFEILLQYLKKSKCLELDIIKTIFTAIEYDKDISQLKRYSPNQLTKEQRLNFNKKIQSEINNFDEQNKEKLNTIDEKLEKDLLHTIKWRETINKERELVPQGMIKITDYNIIFSKNAIETILKRQYSKGKRIMIGINKGDIYLKDDPNGYKIVKASKMYLVNMGYKIMESLIKSGMKTGLCTINEIENNIFKCNFV